LVLPGSAAIPERDDPLRNSTFLHDDRQRSAGIADSFPEEGAAWSSSAAGILAVVSLSKRDDTVGNFLSLTHTATSGSWKRSYAYDEPTVPPGNNRLTTTTVGSTKETYTYDAHGNMLTMPQLVSMAWDSKDQLQATQTQAVTTGPGPQTYYVYDAGGQRVRKVTTSANGNIDYERIYLGFFELYREYGGGGAVTLERHTLHVMDDQQRVALVENRTQGDDDSPAQLIRYQFSNHLGSACLELVNGG
jgi:hypothetical protein